VDVKNKSSDHIDCVVQKSDLSSPPWRFTGFYGAPRAENRHHSWRFLRTLYGIQHDAWLVLGDFNETMYASEHFSRATRPEWQMRAFREAVDDCALQDLGWSGVPYTWDNRQAGDNNVKARLDRALANYDFMQRFEHIRVRHVSAIESDHCFVMVEIKDRLVLQHGRGVRPFRYENVWQTHPDYDAFVFEKWQQNRNGFGLPGIVDTLSKLQSELGSWGSREFGSLAKTVRKLQQKLERLRSQSIGRGPSEQEKETVLQLRDALHREEIWMCQRSRVQWLREGDRNTSYFHAQAAQHKRMNQIQNLQRADGTVCGNEEEDREEVQGFFSESVFVSGI
jgi:hypothetical protein